MRELLERWAKLEPLRCDVFAPGMSPAAWVRLGENEHRISMHDANELEHAVLLAAVIEAIESKGWGWNVGNLLMLPYQATVAAKLSHNGRGDHPAKALLAAYLAALETEATQ